MSSLLRLIQSGAGVVFALTFAIPAQSAPGDTYRTSPERTNLRAGPSDESAIRTTLDGGTEVVELRSDDGWLGVRVLEAGIEGWIYGDLLQRVARSTLDEDVVAGPFRELSPEFDQLVQALAKRLGYRLFKKVERLQKHTLRVTPTREWLLGSDREAQVAIAIALYQMWKNFHDGGQVRMVLLDDQDQDYVSLEDTDAGPVLSLSERVDTP
jgi:hypothetical protein